MKRILLLFALLGTIHAAAAQPFRVFLSPEGDDSRDGLASDRSVLSLARAHEVIVRELTREPKDAEVRIAQGLYAGQVVKWTFFMPDHTITFLPAGDDKDEKDRPVFDGGGTGIWFSFHVDANGARTNLIFQNLKVQNYQTAIGFDGYRTYDKSSSRGNTIDGCGTTPHWRGSHGCGALHEFVGQPGGQLQLRVHHPKLQPRAASRHLRRSHQRGESDSPEPLP